MGAKVGIDATIGEGIPHERYERVAYAYNKDVDVADYIAGKADPVQKHDESAIDKIGEEIRKMIDVEPMYYIDIDRNLSDYDFPTVAAAFGKLHADGKLWKDPFGRICIRGSKFDAKP